MILSQTEDDNKKFMDVLKDEIPTEDLDGVVIYDSDMCRVQVEEGQKVDENFIATRRFQLKHKMFIYRRKRAVWLSMYRGVGNRLEHPIKFDQAYLTRKIKLDTSSIVGVAESSDELVRKVELAVKIKERHCCYRTSVRAGAILSIVFSVFLLYNETMLIFGNTGSAIAQIDSKARD